MMLLEMILRNQSKRKEGIQVAVITNTPEEEAIIDNIESVKGLLKVLVVDGIVLDHLRKWKLTFHLTAILQELLLQQRVLLFHHHHRKMMENNSNTKSTPVQVYLDKD
jgi:hypothetical protein